MITVETCNLMMGLSCRQGARGRRQGCHVKCSKRLTNAGKVWIKYMYSDRKRDSLAESMIPSQHTEKQALEKKKKGARKGYNLTAKRSE
jgi:hypothetical protein